MEITTVMGVPAHPLMVHVPVVLVPLATLGIFLMFWPAWRARIGWIVVLFTGAALFFTQLAINSGQALEESVKETKLLNAHTETAEGARLWVFLFFIAVLVVMVLVTLLKRRAAAAGTQAPSNPPMVLAAVAIAALLGVGASAVIYDVGHSGAKATWADVKIRSGGGESGSGEQGE
ncbi:MAG: DUF2231 domain-containing protein [Actinomycetes bacterium]